MVKRTSKNRQYIAWVLLLAILPLFVVKSFHYHVSLGNPSANHVHHEGEGQEACDNCLICQFFLSPFTEVESFNFTFTQTSTFFETVVYPDKISYGLSYSHYLRAPPVV